MELKYRKVSISGFLLLATALIWLIWDVIAFFFDYKTISVEITAFSYYSPAAPLVMGILIGHWFWPVEVKK